MQPIPENPRFVREIHQTPPMKKILPLLFLTFAIAVSAQDSEHIFMLHYTVDGAAEDDTLFVYFEATEVEVPWAGTISLVGDSGFAVMPCGGPNYPVVPVVTVTIADCNVPGATVTAIAQLDTSINQVNSYWYNAYVDMVPCETDEEEDDFPWEDLDEDALAQYLDSLCGDMLNNDSWWYCGLLESLIACQDGDEEACDDLAEWLETADWSWWQGTDEEEGDCNAQFIVMQAFGEDSVLIANELFVFLLDYNEENDYLWDFGDEGSSVDPFPSWQYETDGPYVLCLTVSNEEADCSETFCTTLSVDSLGWINGLQDGFSIQVLEGDPGNVSLIGAPEPLIEMPRVYPNPSTGATVQVEWKGPSQEPVALGVYDMIGNEVQRQVINRRSADAAFTIQHDLAPGLYIIQLSQGDVTRSVRWVIR